MEPLLTLGNSGDLPRPGDERAPRQRPGPPLDQDLQARGLVEREALVGGLHAGGGRAATGLGFRNVCLGCRVLSVESRV